jgi:hypothetical protein
LNDRIVRALGVSQAEIAQEAERQLGEIARRRRLWLRGRPPVQTRGRTAIVVDDGIATGATVRAALAALGRAGAARRVLAAPVAPRETAEALRELCDEAVFLAEPPDLGSVGAFYADFHQLEDAEVAALLDRADLTAALEAAWRAVRRLNRYVEEQAPWSLARQGDDEALARVLASLVEGLRVVAVILHPWVPESSGKILEAIGAPDIAYDGAAPVVGTARSVQRLAPLFPKYDT